ncbi:hypothetical protein F2P81_005316 [Scophthalmus maximus]|uniref:Uncharacterized protein n=1 Tax=Scophthalmus maximus TaxID=52904 RepID=A0A6A4TEY3_SCOMX|nr:hypothetical protein F2P81_005316 [Scophthalmus maximus]
MESCAAEETTTMLDYSQTKHLIRISSGFRSHDNDWSVYTGKPPALSSFRNLDRHMGKRQTDNLKRKRDERAKHLERNCPPGGGGAPHRSSAKESSEEAGLFYCT